MNEFLNIFWFVFHTVFMLFNMFGWIWKKTRKWHLGALILTALSWFGLGYWYGWGFCICTEWHWQVRRELGLASPPSYTQLLVSEFTGYEMSLMASDILTGGVMALAVILSVYCNVRDFRNRNR